MRLRPILLVSLAVFLNAAVDAGAADNPPFPVTVEAALATEAATRLPLTPFYDTPTPLPLGEPGALIRAEEATDYAFVPGQAPAENGLKAVRFLYHSRTFDGKDVPVSGVILIPYGTPPAGGWPVVAWAHGTTGVGRVAAPSLDKALVYGWEGLLLWPVLGYAVVATDYAGLGSNAGHPYLVAEAQAQDVINALPAARAAYPELGRRWVAIGHSQGARAVIEVAELQVGIRDPGYLGGIAIAGGGDLDGRLDYIDSLPVRAYLAFIALGIKAAYPDFDPAELLSPAALALLPAAEKNGWLGTMATYAYGVPAGKMLNPDWSKSKTLEKFIALTKIGDRPAYGPLLMMAGAADTTSPAQGVEQMAERLKALGATVEYRLYPGLDHDPLVFGSFRDQLRWVEDRFAGRPASAK